MSMGQLWSGIRLVIQPRDQSVSKYVIPVLREWVKRSGAADVRISITCIKIVPFPVGFGVKLTTSVLEELASNAEKIKSLVFIFPENRLESSIEVKIGRAHV